MNMMIFKSKSANELMEVVNEQIKELEKTKVVENIKVQYQTAVIPKMAGDRIKGYVVEYSVLLTFEAMKLLMEA